MRILFVADGRSPIAINWMAYFIDQGYEVHLATTYPCQPGINFAGIYDVPVAFASAYVAPFAGSPGAGSQSDAQMRSWRSSLRRLVPVGLRTSLRQRLGPLTLPAAAQHLSEIVSQVKPDLVHAMRIPFEGMLAARADPAAPLLVSVWGNDFSLHAASTRKLASLTRQALARTDGVHADCQRDIRLAHLWGFPEERLLRVLPGGGGVQLDLFNFEDVEGRQPLVVNPRGFRAYIQNEAFFRAIPVILQGCPQARFVFPVMQGEAQAELWVAELGIQTSVDLLAYQTRPQMAELFRRSQVVVSPSIHDGTPNTLLEAMACGCLPVAGDLESIREWITPGLNGLLVDPNDPQALAEAVLIALEKIEFRKRAAELNRRLIQERAEYQQVMQAAALFYRELIDSTSA